MRVTLGNWKRSGNTFSPEGPKGRQYSRPLGFSYLRLISWKLEKEKKSLKEEEEVSTAAKSMGRVLVGVA